ncbi:protein prenylyltransferase [Tilletiaria anomala UBC 951]|uniref:Protein farnesyltransferase/geranylgeranyltransferase type-1 subunit alpha n=1 Tax=Tilletiaria anomala (strain ATCC 24038 / CBS 436.72 / UBC 951) TaxID=1037660 RepID=A0A066WGK9_TILAU|nr:protein prenylyltransferase [Tilletiaria anomala UBC 951]KDN52916.1 protein prenylyltransferase [Tilletiaria anomala UBC 951]
MVDTQPPFDASSPLWADLSPVYQQECDSPLCPILYDPKYSKAMDLFRALTLKPEYSARALALTTHLIRLNPSNYSLWAFRARILLSESEAHQAPMTDDAFVLPLSTSLRERLAQELDFMDVLAKENMKNYQVWQHRKVVVAELSKCVAVSHATHTADAQPSTAAQAEEEEWKQAAARELYFVAQTLSQDAKNYHTWAYRQWVLCHFGGLPDKRGYDAAQEAVSGSMTAIRRATARSVWAGELAYVEMLLDADLRNNSAWNHRFFTLFASGRAASDDTIASSTPAAAAPDAAALEPEVRMVLSEVEYVQSKLRIARNNCSAWNYLRGIVQRLFSDGSPGGSTDGSCQPSARRELATQIRKEVDAFAHSLIPEVPEARGQDVPLALEWLLDSAELELTTCGPTRSRRLIAEAEEIIKRIKIADPMRTRYWEYRRAGFRAA